MSSRIAWVVSRSELPLDAFGTMVGASKATVSRWLSGEREPKATHLANITRAFRLNGHWLLTGEGSPEIAPAKGSDFLVGVRLGVEVMKRGTRELEQLLETASTSDEAAPRLLERIQREGVAVFSQKRITIGKE